jgi:hypothetical protein
MKTKFVVILFVAALLMTGCDGDDGKDGERGVMGITGPSGMDALAHPPEEGYHYDVDEDGHLVLCPNGYHYNNQEGMCFDNEGYDIDGFDKDGCKRGQEPDEEHVCMPHL